MRSYSDDVFDHALEGFMGLVVLVGILLVIFAILCFLEGLRVQRKLLHPPYARWLLWGYGALLLAALVAALVGSPLPLAITFTACCLGLIVLDQLTDETDVLPHDRILDPWRLRSAA